MARGETAIAVQQEHSVASGYAPPNYMEKLLNGDLTELTPEERTHYYLERCDRLGLDPMSQPFLFLQTKPREGEKPKTILYTTRSATDQIAKRDGLRGTIVSKEILGNLAIVVVRVTGPDGRTMENIGAANFKYDYQAGDALKRATTQGYRRDIIQYSGLGMVSEEDIDDIAGTVKLGLHDITLPAAPEVPRLSAPATKPLEDTRPVSADQLAILRKAAEYLYNEFDEHCSSDAECAAYTYDQAEAEISRRRQRAARLKRGRTEQAAKPVDPIVPQNTEEELESAFPEIPAHLGTP